MNNKHILIADKEIEIGEKLQAENSNPCISVTYAAENTICECIKHNQYDLVVLDNENLSDMLLNVIYTIKKISPKTRIFVTTAKGNIASYISLINLGVNEYVYKPIDPHLFNQMILETIT